MGTLARQWAVGLLGGAVCVVMLALGLWQMRVFENKESDSATARAAQPAVPLLDFIGADGTAGDIYGRQAAVRGRYLPGQQARVQAEDGTVRVVTAFQVADGRVLAVVRGTLPGLDKLLPPPPAGELEQTGIFLPSEEARWVSDNGTQLGSVRLPQLAQYWPQQLLPGFLTLGAADSTAQGLRAAVVVLPTGEGSFTNVGYALQWWVFAAFGAFMTVRFVRAIGRRGTLGTLSDEEDE